MSLKPFRVTQAHLNFLKEKRIFHSAHPSIPGWLKGGTVYKPRGECIVESYVSQRIGPHFNSMGAFSYSRSIFDGVAKMGRYCAVGEWSKVMLAAHPLDRVGMGGFDYADALPYKAEAIDRRVVYDLKPVYENKDPTVEIGDDVWIANSVHLKRGIKIGTGAAVAACSVVTKDVEPYMVVAGNPARPIKRRFSDDLCERLLASEWWQYRPSDLNFMDTLNPEKFLDNLEEAKDTGTIEPFVSPKFDLHVEFARITASETARIRTMLESKKKFWPGFGKFFKLK